MFDQFVGTKPMEERHRIDAAALERFLGFRIKTIEQFKGGQSNPTYRVTAADGKALRAAPQAPRQAPALGARGGPRIQGDQRAASDRLSRSRSRYVLCEDESVIGTAFYVMDCVEGRVLWDQSAAGDVEGRALRHLGRAQPRHRAAAYALTIETIGLADFGKPGNYIARQVARWTKQYQASETERVEAMDNLIAWLPKNIPPETGTTVVHGDFRLDNAIFHPTEPRILAVLDWELSTLGDPLADFAYHCMSWHIPPGQFRGIAGLDLEESRHPDRGEYVKAYCERTGRGGIDPSHWDFYLAYNLFRIAAILQGIAEARGRRHCGVARTHAMQARGRRRWPSSAGKW